MKSALVGLLVAALSLSSACAAADVTVASVPTATHEYVAWWKQVQQCSGVSMALEDAVPNGIITINDRFVVLPDGRKTAASYSRDLKQIWIAMPYLHSSRVVRHEMLHAALASQGIAGHGIQFTRCGLTETIPE